MEKVKIPKEVAEAIEDIREMELKGLEWDGVKIRLLDKNVLNTMYGDDESAEIISDYIERSIENVATYYFAVKHGYDVGPTPEDNVCELYRKYSNANSGTDAYKSGYNIGACDAILETLNTLGIKIEGVNC